MVCDMIRRDTSGSLDFASDFARDDPLRNTPAQKKGRPTIRTAPVIIRAFRRYTNGSLTTSAFSRRPRTSTAISVPAFAQSLRT